MVGLMSVKRWRAWWGAAGMAVLMLAGCGGGAGGDTPATGAIAGQVLTSAQGEPVAGATVRQGTLTATTSADGRFSLAGVPVGARVVVRVQASGYIDALVNTAVNAGQTARLSARLVRASAPTLVDASQAAVVTDERGVAQVSLPAQSLVDAATGAAASGQVSVSVTPIDAGADPMSMPGDYRTADGLRIESFGAVNVTLKDRRGAALNLRPGAKATLRIALSSRSTTPPASIPLYYFDEKTGLWVQEGSATLKGEGALRYYEGEVGHFSTWNADMPQDTIYVHGCLEDAAGHRLPAYMVTSMGLDYSGSAWALTEPDGTFSVPIRKNGRATVWASGDNDSNTVDVGPSSVDITLPRCLVIPDGQQAATIITSPVGQTLDYGDGLVLKVVASGTRPLSYQWRLDGVDIPGATYEMYWFYPVNLSNAGRYTVVVRNAAGTVVSEPADVTVRPAVAPSILIPPEDQTVDRGVRAMFSVLASGSGPLTYQWRRNGAVIPGAIESSYETPATTVADDGATYSVAVTGPGGQVISREATLTVTTPTLTAPTIDVPPLATAATPGTTAYFTVVARGNPSPTYQWLRDGVVIPGAVQSSYTTPTLTLTDDGAMFSVVVTNSQGLVTSEPVRLSVNDSGVTDREALTRLLGLVFEFYDAAAMPTLLVNTNDTTFLDPAWVCSLGSLAGSLNGGALPLPGTAVPPSGTLTATASGCFVGAEAFSGRSTASYSFTQFYPLVGTASATVDKLRQQTYLGDRLVQDVTADGAAAVVYGGSIVGLTVTSTITITPAAGATLKNEISGQTATFSSGSVASRQVMQAGAVIPQSSRYTYDKLSFSVAGVSYLADGAYELTFNAQGVLTGGSGEVILTSSGSRVGRLYANEQGLFIEVDGISQPFGRHGPTRAR